MDIKDIENLAKLVRIELLEEEKKELLSDMDSILGYVKQIEDMKIDVVEAKTDIFNVWRDDKTETQEFSRDIIVEQFPDKQSGFLKVKKIL